MSLPAIESDAQLIAALRRGEPDAARALDARHRGAARALATLLIDRPRLAARVADEAIERARSVVRAGGGPSEVFRPYLLLWVRRFADRLSDQPLPAPVKGPVTLAFAELSEHEQLVLWHRGVEREPPDVAAAGLTSDSIEDAYANAMTELRSRYRAAHSRSLAPGCYQVVALLGIEKSPEDDAFLRSHRDSCAVCTRADYELAAIGASLHRFLVPELVGVPSGEYLRQLSNPSERPEAAMTTRRPRRRLYAAAAAGLVFVVGAAALLATRDPAGSSLAEPPRVLGTVQLATTTTATRPVTASASAPPTTSPAPSATSLL